MVKVRITSYFLMVCFTTTLAQENNDKVAMLWLDENQPIEVRVESFVEALTIDEKISQLSYNSPAIPRLGVPTYNWWNECLHGVARNGRATVFPQAIGLAATFDTNLAFNVATAISDEARAKYNVSSAMGNRGQYAGLTFWTPNINVFRDPRWGRGQETYGEDPYLTSRIGVAFVKGLQGDNARYLKVAACAKHFAVHSGPEGLRHEFNAKPPIKDFYETYLPAFQALVQEANVESVMGAYNRVYDSPACGSNLLLQQILREEWGFKGHVVSDCWAIRDFYTDHKVVADVTEAAAMALNAGVDLNCGDSYPALKQALAKGLVTEETIDQRLKTLIATRFRLGMFDDAKLNPYNAIPESVINCDKHVELAYETAVKSIVMLKNSNNVLPLDKNIKSIYVTGPFATSSEVLIGNYYGVSNTMVNMLEGITRKVSSGTSINYKPGCLPFGNNLNPIDWTTGEAKFADAMIVCLGISQQMEGEEGDAIASPTKGDRFDLHLPENQIMFLKKLRKNNKKPIIVVLTGGSPMVIPEVEELADAILFAWYPGQEGGRAVGDIIFGDYSPSGKLPVTFPENMEQLPPFEDYSMKQRTYRYLTGEPLYPFGYGLSYSNFSYSGIAVSDAVLSKNDSLNVWVKLTNNGKMDADEVTQFYVQTPGAGTNQPLSSLKGFVRKHVKAGQTVTVNLTINRNDLYTYDEIGKKQLLKGKYTIIAGNASPGKRAIELGAATPVYANFEVR